MGKNYMLCTLSVGVADAQNAGNAWCEGAFRHLIHSQTLALLSAGMVIVLVFIVPSPLFWQDMLSHSIPPTNKMAYLERCKMEWGRPDYKWQKDLSNMFPLVRNLAGLSRHSGSVIFGKKDKTVWKSRGKHRVKVAESLGEKKMTLIVLEK